MSTRSFVRIEHCVLAVVLLVAGVAHAADKKQELYDQAMKAGSAGKADDARRLMCELARMDPKFKDATQLCTIMTQEAENEKKLGDQRFAEGMQAFNEGRFDDAEQKFKNVRGGSHVDEARQYLAKIPAARTAKQAADAEGTKFDQGTAAYRSNDFAGAKAALSQLTGKRATEAQTYLENIRHYEQAMAAGDAVATSDPQKAINSYNEALAIKGDGPGDPRGKISRVQTALSAAARATPPAPAPVTKKPEEVVAVKQAPRVDTNKLLREAAAAQARNDLSVASGLYVAVLAADPNNAVARQALSVLSSRGIHQSAGSEADKMLARGMGEYYTGLYEDAEVHINDYLNFNGSHTALSQFYLGAIRATRYFLGGETDKKLLSDAKAHFQVARGTAGFTPPDQKVISPRILQVYQDASQ